MVHLFILFPISNSAYNWQANNDKLYDAQAINDFIQALKNKLHAIRIEQYEGYYDGRNLSNFLADFSELEEYFPSPKRHLQLLLKRWNNWRDDIQQAEGSIYQFFHQVITNHSFCEIAERKLTANDQAFVLLNHNGHRLGNSLIISVEDEDVYFDSVSTKRELINWFAEHRIPMRNFHIIPKHGENRQETIRWQNGELVSPLKCSREEAQAKLHFAIGDSIRELFTYDESRASFIVFKYEGNNPQNLYHGYHISENSSEVPSSLKIEAKQIASSLS